ncbi:MAG: [LysW]-lysine hydrolase [Phycisphaerae bacterium]|nr:[LysW]-lysine hydrolase [Phycisphaerae bacterium]
MSASATPRSPVVSDEQAVGLLRSLVEIESLSGQERRLAEFLVERMTTLGLSAWIDEAGSAVGARGLEAHGAAREWPIRVDLALLGHMDTVPGRIPVRIENGRLYGRGAVDAKGPLAAFVVAAATACLPAGFRVAVIGAVEEESTSARGARHAAKTFEPSACIVGEPSGTDGVTLGYKGRLLAEFHARVASSHSAGPEPTAAELVTGWWERVRSAAEAMNPQGAGIFDRVQARLRSIWSRHDGLEERAAARVGFRIPPGIPTVDLRQICVEASQGLAGPLGELAFEGDELPVRAPRDTALVRALTTAIRGEGLTPRFVLKTGTSDMNVVAPAWQCAIAAFGAGDSHLDHTPDEHVVVEDYLRSVRILRRAIESLAAPGA